MPSLAGLTILAALAAFIFWLNSPPKKKKRLRPAYNRYVIEPGTCLLLRSDLAPDFMLNFLVVENLKNVEEPPCIDTKLPSVPSLSELPGLSARSSTIYGCYVVSDSGNSLFCVYDPAYNAWFPIGQVTKEFL